MTSAAEAPQAGYRALFDLTGQRALVVGAGSGIGLEAARALADFGAQVGCADRDLAAATDAAGQAGPGAYPLQLDMMDDAALTEAAAGLPGLDVLVFTPASNVRKRLLAYTAAEFDQVMRLNLRSSFNLVRAFGKGMVERGRGSIIGFTSIRASTTEPGQGVYAASKAGLVQLLRTAAVEWGPAGVRVNLIAPGVVETPLTAPIRAVPQWYAAYADKSVLGRWARPSELAGAVVYLASEAASYVTGSVLTVDGGWTAADGRYTPPE
jgi:NAD(P)-dependent dehydrogenase (short-subunit alcohol dehydrogenase family)